MLAVAAILLLAVTASPEVRSEQGTTNTEVLATAAGGINVRALHQVSPKQEVHTTRKMLQKEPSAATPSAPALTPLVLAFMGVNDNSAPAMASTEPAATGMNNMQTAAKRDP